LEFEFALEPVVVLVAVAAWVTEVTWLSGTFAPLTVMSV
jgi:hypothetical protein